MEDDFLKLFSSTFEFFVGDTLNSISICTVDDDLLIVADEAAERNTFELFVGDTLNSGSIYAQR